MDAAPVVPQHPPQAKRPRKVPATLDLNKELNKEPNKDSLLRPEIVIPDVSEIIERFQKEMDELKQRSMDILRAAVSDIEQVRTLVLAHERETRANVEKARAFKRKVQDLLMEDPLQ